MNLSKLRADFPHTVNKVAYGGERVVIHRRGRPLAALIPVADLVLVENKAGLFALQDALEDLEAEIKAKGQKVPRTLARALAALGKIEGVLAEAVAQKAKAEMVEKGLEPVTWEAVKKRLGL